MSGAITGIDHALVGVADLEAARQRWTRLGFTLSPRGRHIGWGTANYCIMFEKDYVELLGILDPSQFTNNLDRFLEGGEGLLGVAFSCADAPAAAEALRARGIAAEDPRDLKRILEAGEDAEGEELPEFQLVHLPPEATPGVASFVVSHLTPEIVWRPDWTRHPNGALAIDSFTLAVDDPQRSMPAYAKLFGDNAVASENLRLTVTTGGARLKFLAAEAADEIAPLPPRGTPCGLAMAVRVSDLGRARGILEQNGIAFETEGETLLRVAPEEANGLALEFVS